MPSKAIALLEMPKRSRVSDAAFTAAWLAKVEPSFALPEKL
jgi:hypothetical protein